MNKLLPSFCLLILILRPLPSLVAQPAIYFDDVFTIPAVAIVGSDNPTFYTDIQLHNEGEEDIELFAAPPINLVYVDTVAINILESFPVQVRIMVTGNKSVPCVELQTPAITRKDNAFSVVLAETQLGPAESCIAVLDPFETSFALDVVGLAAGTYTVTVNGVVTSFVLAIDNQTRVN
jgi:hypothetical protein